MPMGESAKLQADVDALQQAGEDAAVLAIVEAHRAHEARVGWETAKAGYYTAEEAQALLDGVSPVKVWRGKRDMTLLALAQAARISPRYLAEVEAGLEPGSEEALKRLAKVLAVSAKDLVSVVRLGPSGHPSAGH